MAISKSEIKKTHLLQLAVAIVILLIINIAGNIFFKRFDLTAEKRFTLSKATVNKLKQLDDVVYFRIYLEGDFPAGFKRLRNATREMLDEFRAYNSDIQYEFINPSASPDKKTRNNVYQQLMGKGLEPTAIKSNDKDVQSQQIIFPGALVTYHNKEIPVQLLNSQIGVPPEEQLNNSIQNLEYNLINAINKLTVKEKPSIAFIYGHGELDELETADALSSLSEYYNVERVKINEQISSLTEHKILDSTKTHHRNKFKAIIIARPDSVFSEKDKFIIDQYIMYGGRVLWLIDPVFARMDSLQKSNETMGIALTLNIDDMLFKYGVRLQSTLVQDLSALPIPVNTQPAGSTPQFEFFPWIYSPLIFSQSSHPIVRNINAIKTEFISPLDTIEVTGVKKTILLTSSKYSRTQRTPATINLKTLFVKPDMKYFNKSYIPVAALLEGKFTSVYKGRLTPEFTSLKEIGYQQESKPTRMIVVSDGDIIKNQLQYSNGQYQPYPLGYDKYTGKQYGNKDFIMNAVNYLCDDSGLLEVRSREIKIRLLDKALVEKRKVFWQTLNVLIPVLIVVVFGVLWFFIRKRRFQTVKKVN